MSASLWLFFALLIAVVIERLHELRLARRNAERLLARGGYAVGDGHYRYMVLLHAAFLVAMPLEVAWLDRPFLPWLGWPMVGLLAATMALRYWVISTLGDRWTTRVIVVPGEAPVTGGPYRYLRHPNYLAVIFEVAALPLVHTAWLTAIVVSGLNLWLLIHRISVEEKALGEASDYRRAFGDRPRLVPGAERTR